jgi:hypothetical protein
MGISTSCCRWNAEKVRCLHLKENQGNIIQYVSATTVMMIVMMVFPRALVMIHFNCLFVYVLTEATDGKLQILQVQGRKKQIKTKANMKKTWDKYCSSNLLQN